MKYTLKFRIWHWLNAIVVLGLVATVLLRWTFLSKSVNADILTKKLLSFDISITSEQSVLLAKALRVELWEWHIILGYAFLALVIFRVYLYFKDSSKKVAFKDLDMHHKVVHASYYVLYTSFFVMVATGFFIYFYKDLGVSKDLAHDIKEIHELVYYYIAIFIPLHLGGVFFADATQENGLVSSMIHGKDTQNNV
ncbi:cytochrome b/b6 domain-containing protein [Sulfurimonas aquatica]|uniref:Cytochrome b/b6 domain-containing protein n=1 Tax=Sulfurimonas aquatica TaxID=2672570 RepID=A0A975B026_9BACT|nr:cytochrome b/b6 domain-containing protein [Sulfurimonas aquatica]QSZ41749.1 cytochrome b/b6 domain-containing protein [Sulfurimonas aquatica]